MEILLLIFNAVLGVVNVLLLIALAGTVAKMLKYMTGEREEEGPPPARTGLTDLLSRQPTYADLIGANYDGVRPLPPNSDGVGGAI